MKIRHSTEKIIVCIQPLGWLSLGAINLGTFQLWRNLTNDTFGYLVLETKDIFQISLGATCPKLSPSAGIDQLTSNPYLVLRFAYAAFEHVADPELATFCHAALDVDGATDSIQGAGELHEHTIAGGLHDASAVFAKLAINKR